MRLGAAVGGLLPELTGRLQRRLGSDEIAAAMAEGQRGKRQLAQDARAARAKSR